jgi:hypothetical protein
MQLVGYGLFALTDSRRVTDSKLFPRKVLTVLRTDVAISSEGKELDNLIRPHRNACPRCHLVATYDPNEFLLGIGHRFRKDIDNLQLFITIRLISTLQDSKLLHSKSKGALQPRPIAQKKADLAFSRKLVQLHIVLNLPPFQNLNPYFLMFIERYGYTYGYNIGVTELRQLLMGWHCKAPIFLDDSHDVDKIMILMTVWLALKQHWLAGCFTI